MRSGKLKEIMLYNENKINWKHVLFTGRAFFIGVGICAVQYEIHTKMTIKVM